MIFYSYQKTEIILTLHWINTLVADLETCQSQNAGGYTVGINGLDCAGKTTLALGLKAALESRGQEARLMHVDDYNNIQGQKRLYAAYEAGEFGATEFQEYYSASVDYPKLRAAIARARQGGSLTIVEGVFLFKPELADLIDYKVLLNTPENLAFKRYKNRKAEVGDTRSETVFTDIWVPAYKRYCEECQPEVQADRVFQQ
jgi:uridine kinase